MKKLTSLLVVATLWLTAGAFAPSPETRERAAADFTQRFVNVAQVRWEEKGDYYFAHFTEKGCKMQAAYNREGEMLALCRTLKITDLSEALQAKLKTKYAGYRIEPEVTEVQMDNETSYYLVASNANKILRLKGYEGGRIMVDHKQKR